MSCRLWLSLAAVVATGLASLPASSAPTLVGTLACTAEPAPAQASEPGWQVACAFERAGTGSIQQYRGEIAGLDQAARLSGKVLLTWSVLAAASAHETSNLVGVYTLADDKGLPERSLVGGRDQSIVLQPLSSPEQRAAPPIDMIKLELPKV
jgi:hypothetical protein